MFTQTERWGRGWVCFDQGWLSGSSCFPLPEASVQLSNEAQILIWVVTLSVVFQQVISAGLFTVWAVYRVSTCSSRLQSHPLIRNHCIYVRVCVHGTWFLWWRLNSSQMWLIIHDVFFFMQLNFQIWLVRRSLILSRFVCVCVYSMWIVSHTTVLKCTVSI